MLMRYSDLATTEKGIHITYQQTVAATGRLSSINPNSSKHTH